MLDYFFSDSQSEAVDKSSFFDAQQRKWYAVLRNTTKSTSQTEKAASALQAPPLTQRDISSAAEAAQATFSELGRRCGKKLLSYIQKV